MTADLKRAVAWRNEIIGNRYEPVPEAPKENGPWRTFKTKDELQQGFMDAISWLEKSIARNEVELRQAQEELRFLEQGIKLGYFTES